ncbi:MAG TPA: GNAT family N-acetyltransferase [Myxococcota bacterium]|nr:GNAT family N-acetyltransferase [Myxococcota bacterium]
MHWSRFLGVPGSALQEDGIVVTQHAQLGSYRGVWFFVRENSAVVSAPPEWVAPLERALGSVELHQLLSPEFVGRVLGDAAARIIGRSYQGWLPPDRFVRTPSDRVRRLDETELGLAENVRAPSSPEEWEQGGIEIAGREVSAAFSGPQIVSLGQLRAQPGDAADPCIITHPSHRGHGHARRLMSTMVEAALSAGKLVLYQTLLSNGPAVSLAHSIGFNQYATLRAARFVSRSPAF